MRGWHETGMGDQVADAGVDYGQVWRHTLASLENAGMSTRNSAFVRLCRLVGVLDQTALVRVPNDLTKEMLETKLREPLTLALADHLGHPVQLAVSVDESLEVDPALLTAEPTGQPALGMPANGFPGQGMFRRGGMTFIVG